MNDPAKTEARKVAAAVKDVVHKVGMSLSGKGYVYPERIMYENIQLLAWAIEHKERLIKTGQYTEKQLRLEYNEQIKWAQDSLAGAIIDNDVDFFERMADLARLKKSGKHIDEKAAYVGVAVLALRRAKRTVTAYAIAKHLNERWPKPDRAGKIIKGDKTPTMDPVLWTPREVLEIMGTIGIKGDRDTKKRLVSSH